MHCQIEFCHPQSLCDLLNAENRYLLARILLMVANEICAMDEHSSRTTGRVKDASVKRFYDCDNQSNKTRRRIKLSAFLHRLDCEVAHEVFVNLPESIARDFKR